MQVIVIGQSDVQQLFNIFPQSRSIGIKQLKSLQEEVWNELKHLPFLSEEFRSQNDQKSSLKPESNVEIFLRKMMFLLRDLSNVELSENDSELLKEHFEVCKLIDYLLKTRSEINQTLKEQMSNERNDKSYFKVLETLEELNRFCPQEVWGKERFELATFVLDKLPANTDSGFSFFFVIVFFCPTCRLKATFTL